MTKTTASQADRALRVARYLAGIACLLVGAMIARILTPDVGGPLLAIVALGISIGLALATSSIKDDGGISRFGFWVIYFFHFLMILLILAVFILFFMSKTDSDIFFIVVFLFIAGPALTVIYGVVSSLRRAGTSIMTINIGGRSVVIRGDGVSKEDLDKVKELLDSASPGSQAETSR